MEGKGKTCPIEYSSDANQALNVCSQAFRIFMVAVLFFTAWSSVVSRARLSLATFLTICARS